MKRYLSLLGVLVALSLGSLLPLARPVAASSPIPPRGMVPTNLPDAYTFPEPPATFDPTTAGTPELQRYGFPLPPNREKNPLQYRHWLDLVRHAKHAVLPRFTPDPMRKNNTTSTNWSGTVMTGANNLGLCRLWSDGQYTVVLHE